MIAVVFRYRCFKFFSLIRQCTLGFPKSQVELFGIFNLLIFTDAFCKFRIASDFKSTTPTTIFCSSSLVHSMLNLPKELMPYSIYPFQLLGKKNCNKFAKISSKRLDVLLLASYMQKKLRRKRKSGSCLMYIDRFAGWVYHLSLLPKQAYYLDLKP